MDTNAQPLSLHHMTMIGLMASVLCILGPLSVPIPISPVPLSLTNLAIFFATCILGWKYGTLSYLLYLFMGIFGVPVFSGFTSGFAKLIGPTGGYLTGMIITAMISGMAFEKFQSRAAIFFCLAAGVIISYITGTLWLCHQAHLTFLQGLWAGVLPYIPGDLIKIIIAVIMGPTIKRRLSASGLL